MKTHNFIIYTASSCLYIACAYGSYNLISMNAPVPVHPVAETESPSPEPPQKVEVAQSEPQISNKETPKEKREDLDVLAKRADEAGIDVGEWSEWVNESANSEKLPQQLEEMTTYAAQAGIGVKDLSRLAGKEIDSPKIAPKLEALQKIVEEKTSKLSQFATNKISSAKSVVGNIKNTMVSALNSPSPSESNLGTENIQAAQKVLSGGALPASTGPALHPDDVSGAVNNLQANVNTISSVPDALKGALNESGLGGGPLVDPNQYFAGQPKVGETSGSNRNSSTDSGSLNTMADNLQILAAAGKGLADMAGNLTLPVSEPDTESSNEPVVQNSVHQIKEEVTEQVEKITDPVEVSKVVDNLSKTQEAATNKLFALLKKYSAESSALGISIGLVLYWKIAGRKKPEKNKKVLKAKYERAHQYGLAEDYTSAQRVFNEIIKEYPEEFDARLFLGGILWRKLNDPKEALVQYKFLEKEIKKQSIDYIYKDKLKENIEKVTEQLRESTVVT